VAQTIGDTVLDSEAKKARGGGFEFHQISTKFLRDILAEFLKEIIEAPAAAQPVIRNLSGGGSALFSEERIERVYLLIFPWICRDNGNSLDALAANVNVLI